MNGMYYDSPLGRLVAAETDGALAGLWMESCKYFRKEDKEDVEIREHAASPVLEQTKEWLDRYFGGERPSAYDLPLAPRGSAFRRQVWKILCEIPYGEVTTYGEIAGRIAAGRGNAAMLARAVGGAVGHNPVSIIIPCHRVIGSGGNLTGYAGGIDKKIWLLKLEGADMDGMYIPEKGKKRRAAAPGEPVT